MQHGPQQIICLQRRLASWHLTDFTLTQCKERLLITRSKECSGKGKASTSPTSFSTATAFILLLKSRLGTHCARWYFCPCLISLCISASGTRCKNMFCWRGGGGLRRLVPVVYSCVSFSIPANPCRLLTMWSLWVPNSNTVGNFRFNIS